MEIIPNVHQIPGMRGANTYLLLGTTLTLVDTGWPGSADIVLGYIEGLGLNAADLSRIVVTHCHLDHMGSLAALKARTSAQVLAHPEDAVLISGEQSPPPAPSAIVRFLFWLLAPLMPNAERVPVDLTVQDGDHLDMGGPLGGATVIHVPGHSPGSIGLWEERTGMLFSGDCIYDGELLDGLDHSDPEAYRRSLRRLRDLPVTVVHAGHESSFGRARLLELIDAYLKRRSPDSREGLSA